MFRPSLTCEKDSKIHELLHLRQELSPRQDSLFSSTASLTSGVHHRVRVLLPRQALETLLPQLRRAASTMEVENMVHSDSMSPASLGNWSKLSRRWELKTSPTEGSTRRSQQTPICPASSPASGSDSPPDGDQLTAQPLSSPKCPRHTAGGRMTPAYRHFTAPEGVCLGLEKWLGKKFMLR